MDGIEKKWDSYVFADVVNMTVYAAGEDPYLEVVGGSIHYTAPVLALETRTTRSLEEPRKQ